VTRFSSQLRVAGMGAIIGLELPFLLDMAIADGVEREIALHLLPHAEAGVVAALNEKD